ncbi:Hypothetical predicted protein [Octopus vulgaris]|uniref:Uncharacterized protein n=1 Tax=Octopus vulgaris TaxID=6645 RepID=A0AA36BL75_OCTVU|nr:Hypothetical predicted protein [Octopus vulgaris]
MEMFSITISTKCGWASGSLICGTCVTIFENFSMHSSTICNSMHDSCSHTMLKAFDRFSAPDLIHIQPTRNGSLNVDLLYSELKVVQFWLKTTKLRFQVQT